MIGVKSTMSWQVNGTSLRTFIDRLPLAGETIFTSTPTGMN